MKIGSFTILVIGLIFMYHVEELDQKLAFEFCKGEHFLQIHTVFEIFREKILS